MQTLAFDYLNKAQPVLAAPELSRQLVLIIIGVAVLVLFVKAALKARTDGGTFLLVLACSLIGSIQEGFAEHIAMVYQPELGTVQAYRSWNKPVPLHVVMAYVLYFGVAGYYLLDRIRKGASTRWWWQLFWVGAIACLLADWAALHAGIWLYHGPQVMVVWMLPIWIMFTNNATVFAYVAVMHLCLAKLKGRDRGYALLLVPLALIGATTLISFGASTALYSDFSHPLRVLWSLGSIATSFLVMHFCIRYFRSQAGVRVD